MQMTTAQMTTAQMTTTVQWKKMTDQQKIDTLLHRLANGEAAALTLYSVLGGKIKDLQQRVRQLEKGSASAITQIALGDKPKRQVGARL
jgi:hypothetical protein